MSLSEVACRWRRQNICTAACWQNLVVGLGGNREFRKAKGFMNAYGCPKTIRSSSSRSSSSSNVPLAKLLSSKHQGCILSLCTSNLIRHHQRWLPTGWCCLTRSESSQLPTHTSWKHKSAKRSRRGLPTETPLFYSMNFNKSPSYTATGSGC